LEKQEILYILVKEMIYIFGIIFFVGVVLAIIRAEPEEKKPRKRKKKNWWFQNHNWRGPLPPPMI